MIEFTLYDEATGRISGVGIGPELPNNAVEGIFSGLDYYVDSETGVPKEIGKPPGDFYVWSWDFKQWIPNLDAGRTKRIQQITHELSTRLYLPYNGFDADPVSRERISGMIARLQRGDGLPDGWIGWRDASNQMHWVNDDASTVLSNLVELARGIENREQALLVASWNHKTNINALTDIDSVISYDTTAGWPE